jgi:hypothetical protein
MREAFGVREACFRFAMKPLKLFDEPYVRRRSKATKKCDAPGSRLGQKPLLAILTNMSKLRLAGVLSLGPCRIWTLILRCCWWKMI